jgi:hypothetical protein
VADFSLLRPIHFDGDGQLFLQKLSQPVAEGSD